MSTQLIKLVLRSHTPCKNCSLAGLIFYFSLYKESKVSLQFNINVTIVVGLVIVYILSDLYKNIYTLLQKVFIMK